MRRLLFVALLNLGPTELVLVLVLLLLLFGADKLPQMARSLGQARAKLESAQREVKSAIQTEEDALLAEQLKFEAAREEHMRQQNAEFEALRKTAQDLGIATDGLTTPEGLREAIRGKAAAGEKK